MRPFAIFLLFCLVLCNLLQAQPRQQYLFTHLGLQEGLLSEEVMCVQQDAKGFLWISTNNGLQRYDGHRFITFQKKQDDTNFLPSNYISWLKIDNKERLWMFFPEKNKVGYMNVSDFTFHEIPVNTANHPLISNIGHLEIDQRGNIFFYVERDRIFIYHEDTHEFSEQDLFTLPVNWKPIFLHQDNLEHNYWISCDSGLVKYNPTLKTLSYRGHNIDQDPVIQEFSWLAIVFNFYFDSNDRFWIYAWPKDLYVYCFDLKTKKTTLYNQELGRISHGQYFEIHSFFEQKDGTMWFTGLNMFTSLSPNESSLEAIPRNTPSEFSIRFDMLRNLYEDKEKNIWVSTNKGLYRFNPSAQLFTIINNIRYNKDSFYTSEVTDIKQLRNGNILVSTWGNGVFSYNENFKPIKTAVASQSVSTGEGLTWCIWERANGDIWRGNQDGYIYIYHKATGTTKKILDPVFENSTIRQMTEDRFGNLWFGTHRGLLVRWLAAENRFVLVKRLTTIYRLYTDLNGDVWACTGNMGVHKADAATGKITASYYQDAPEGKRLNGLGAVDILQYNDSLYIIVSEGIDILNSKNDSIRLINTGNGFPSNAVYNIMKDREGFLWISIENNLWRWNLQKGVFAEFTTNDGLPSSSYEYGSTCMLRDGRLVFGRTHDLVAFDPEKINHIKLPTPPVELTGFILMNKSLPVDSLRKKNTIELPYNENSIIIEFSTLTYLNTFAVSYRMEGIDEEWIQASNDVRQAVYTYLPPGNYVFKVRCTNGEGRLSPETTLRITVQPPFWRTWWFYSIIALLVAGLLYWIDRERMRRKEAMQKIRSEIAGNLYEEINTALNNINVLSEIARLKADGEPEQSKNYISEIHHKSHNMIIAMDDMLWSIDPANDSMAKTVERMKEFADALRNRYDVAINFQTDDKVISLKPDMKTRHEVMLIFKQALRLLIEKPRARQTIIQLDYQKAQLQLNIFSPGIKLADNNNQVIKAIEEMKARAHAIRALFEIQSDEKGTEVFLAVKLN